MNPPLTNATLYTSPSRSIAILIADEETKLYGSSRYFALGFAVYSLIVITYIHVLSFPFNAIFISLTAVFIIHYFFHVESSEKLKKD